MSPRDPEVPPWQDSMGEEPCMGPDEGAGEDGPWAAGWGDRVGTDIAFVQEMLERSKRDDHGIVGSDIRKLAGLYLVLAVKQALDDTAPGKEIVKRPAKTPEERLKAAMEIPRANLLLDEIRDDAEEQAARLEKMMDDVGSAIRAAAEEAKNLPKGGLLAQGKDKGLFAQEKAKVDETPEGSAAKKAFWFSPSWFKFAARMEKDTDSVLAGKPEPDPDPKDT